MRKKTDFWDFLSVLILALFALFLIAPLFSLLAAGLRGADGWTLEHVVSPNDFGGAIVGIFSKEAEEEEAKEE